ncbi:uncharacterized protein MELLADRAFT_89125 [Melampsora larici-populina 98AG31]|uniref:Alpha-type protein kinase domain-containing protein n=1 Tax=Melampsora larici-populina (strain 98AG31 / pathotype 3-4-7) TaxID=747676 RepID=F4R513_MELLP|nr:uncharacterized protein MELLADRAFT_89125 [Melampsora larici-populina 98AG31]EGG12353.1 hypothetical protein MELLADRAFT_89125 [Melampsora larici-populina 98AG31]
MSSVCKKCHINLVEQKYTQFKMCGECLKKLSNDIPPATTNTNHLPSACGNHAFNNHISAVNKKKDSQALRNRFAAAKSQQRQGLSRLNQPALSSSSASNQPKTSATQPSYTFNAKLAMYHHGRISRTFFPHHAAEIKMSITGVESDQVLWIKACREIFEQFSDEIQDIRHNIPTYPLFFQSEYFYITSTTRPPVKITPEKIKEHLSNARNNGLELIFEAKKKNAKKQNNPSTSEEELDSISSSESRVQKQAKKPKYNAPASSSAKISDDSSPETLELPSNILTIQDQHKKKPSVSSSCQNQPSQDNLMGPPSFLPSSTKSSTFTLNNGSTHLAPTLRQNIPILQTDYNHQTKFTAQKGSDLLLTVNNHYLGCIDNNMLSLTNEVPIGALSTFNNLGITEFATPFPVIPPSTPSTPIQLIYGRKLVLKVDPSSKHPGWTPVNFKYHVFTDQEIGRGSCRICYNALGEMNGKVCKMVAKQLITNDAVGKEILNSYTQTQQVYMAVSRYLKKFQAVVNSFVAYSGKHDDLDPKNIWFFEESLVDQGKFQKYNSNVYFKTRRVGDPIHLCIAAFTHYVYKITSHKRLVADLQGAGLYLTDPLILDSGNAWVAETNTAEQGFANFEDQHHCYPLCRQLGLPFLPNQSSSQDHDQNHDDDYIAQHVRNGGRPDLSESLASLNNLLEARDRDESPL